MLRLVTMALAESSKEDLIRSEKRPMFSKGRMPSWGHDPPQALVYRQGELCLDVEEINDKPTASYFNHGQRLVEESNSFEISLSQWRNQVHVYIDMEARQGYMATLRLDRIELKKKRQRHLGMNYKMLHVKGP